MRSLIKDTAVYGLTDFLFRFLNFAIFPILAFVLSLAEFGVYSLVTTFSLLVATLFNCGLNRSLERFYLDSTQTEKQRNAAVSMGLVLEAFFALLFICPGLGLIYWNRESLSEWKAFALALICCLPTQLFNLSLNALRLQFLPWHFALMSLLQNGLSLALSLFFILHLKWGVTGFVAGMAIGYGVGAPVALFQLFRRVHWVWDWTLAKALVKFGYPFLFIDVARWIFTSIDRWMLAEFADATEVGLYGMAFKLSTVLIFMIGAFSLAWTPRALKAHGEDPHHPLFFSRCLTLWFFSLTLVAMLLHLFGGECLRLLTPPAYWPAAKLLPYVTTGLALFGTTYVTVIGVMIVKKTHHLTRIAWGAAALNILLNLLWAPRFGAVGSAAATLVTYAGLSASSLYVAQRLYPLPLEYPKLALTLLLLLGSAFVSLYLNTLPWSSALLLPKGVCFAFALFSGLFVIQTPGSKKAVSVQ